MEYNIKGVNSNINMEEMSFVQAWEWPLANWDTSKYFNMKL